MAFLGKLETVGQVACFALVIVGGPVFVGGVFWFLDKSPSPSPTSFPPFPPAATVVSIGSLPSDEFIQPSSPELTGAMDNTINTKSVYVCTLFPDLTAPANARSGPGMDYPVIRTYPKGATIACWGGNVGEWAQSTTNEFIHRSLVASQELLYNKP